MDVLKFECPDYLITISTASVNYAWDRFVRRVRSAAQTYCAYSSSRKGTLKLRDLPAGKNELVAQNDEIVPCEEWPQLWPVLFETCKYQFAVEFKQGLDISIEKQYPHVRHQLKSIGENFKFYSSSSDSGILVGDIDFLNSPGKFSFAFDYWDTDGLLHHEKMELYVASPKLDTKNDLQQIMALINQEYENYIYDYLTLTFSSFALQRSVKNNHIIWLSIFRSVVDEYFRNVRFVMSRPNNKPVRKTYHARPERIRRWSQREEERYRNMGQDAEMHYFRYEQTENTINTRENRFVKYTLHVLGKKFREVFSELGTLPNVMDAEERQLLEDYQRQFKRLETSPFFQKVGEFEGFRQESAILQQRMGYSKIYKAWLMLKNSLELVDGKTDIGMKQIWELYEIWCFLVMKRLIAKVLELDLQKPDNHVREDKSKMLNTIVKSEMTHIIEFDNVKNGDKVCLEYQHTYNRRTKEFSTTTTEQRPDIVVTIKKKDGFVLTYLYDAKYRLQDDARDGELDEGVSIDVADYPLPDAINQMHRYRDAIYYSMKTEVRPSAKEIIGGYILFPGRVVGDEIYGRYFYQSIRKVNIGAFPLLPATKENEDDIIQCDLLERHLREILLEDSVYEHVKDSIPQKGLVYGTENVFVLAVDRDAYDDYEHNRFSIEIPLDINKGMFKIDSIDYFMFIVENASEGYYRVSNSRLRIKDDKLILALSLTDYQSFEFGFKEVAECDTKTIVSLRDLLNVR
ncbi:DUF2357 domain-containing protein [Segatella copri]|uniref:DUF2357 domain-containing protein n=1 Tax=Segatella copri TaxID=165179 RepID=UPI003D03FE78